MYRENCVRSNIMEKEKLIFFRHENQKGVFHYDLYEGEFVALSILNSGKMEYIKNHGALDLSFEENGTFDVWAVDVIEDPEYVQNVYDHFEATGNSYFQNGIEGICVLKFHR